MDNVNLSTDPELLIECIKCGWTGKAKEVMPENPAAEYEGYCRKCGGLLFYENNEQRSILWRMVSMFY